MCYNCVFYLLHTCILFTVIILFSLFRELASWIWCWFSSNYSRSTYILSWFAVLSFHYLYTFWKDGAYLKWEKRVMIVCLVFIIINCFDSYYFIFNFFWRPCRLGGCLPKNLVIYLCLCIFICVFNYLWYIVFCNILKKYLYQAIQIIPIDFLLFHPLDNWFNLRFKLFN